MLWSPLLLPDAQVPLIEGFRLNILALLTVEVRQSIERSGHIGMLGSQLLLVDVQYSLVEWLGFCITALLTVEVRQRICVPCGVEMLGSLRLFTHRIGLHSERFGFVIAGALG